MEEGWKEIGEVYELGGAGLEGDRGIVLTGWSRVGKL